MTWEGTRSPDLEVVVQHAALLLGAGVRPGAPAPAQTREHVRVAVHVKSEWTGLAGSWCGTTVVSPHPMARSAAVVLVVVATRSLHHAPAKTHREGRSIVGVARPTARPTLLLPMACAGQNRIRRGSSPSGPEEDP